VSQQKKQRSYLLPAFTAMAVQRPPAMNFAAMQSKFMKCDPDELLSPATPNGKRKGTWDDDCCSTALPSPWAGGGPDSPSPWPSPAPGSWALSPAPAHGTPGSVRQHASVSCATFVPSDLAGCLEMDFVEAMALRLPPVPEGTMRPGSPGDSDMVFSPDSWNSMTPPPLWNPVAPVDSEMLTPPPSPLASSRDVAPVTPCKPVRTRTPWAPCKAAMPRLLSVLQCWDAAGVRQELENDPECAQFPFWEHALEPPLCAAVRLGCGPEIIELLLAHGAAVDAVDAKGRTPMDILKADTCRWGSMPFNDELVDGGRIAALLTQAGSQESTSGGEIGVSETEEAFVGEGHRTPLPAMPDFYSRSATARKLF